MKKVRFYNLPKYLNYGQIKFDGDKKDFRLHSDENYSWAARTKKEYTAIEKQIEKLGSKGDGWAVYAWCDSSGYSYWMKQQKENNYISVTISFDKSLVLESEISKIDEAINKILADCDAIESESYQIGY